MKKFKRILVATDLSTASTAAVDTAIQLAQDDGVELLIAHAYEPPSPAHAEAVAPGVYEEWDTNLRNEVEAKLATVLEGALAAHVNARPLVLQGAPEEAITEAARENHADLVVMGTHARTGVARLFVGSVASRVISTAPCPVMTVRAA